MASLDELLEQAEEKIEKGEGLDEFEVEHHHKVRDHVEKKSVNDQIKESKIKKAAAESAEVEVAEKAEGEAGEAETQEKEGEAKKTAKPKKAKVGKAKIRSKKYQEAKALIDSNKKYDIEEAIELVKKASFSKFDGNVEVHIRILGKSGKPEQIRSMIQYPHSTGKKTTVVVLDDKTIEEIAKSGKADADIYLTTPADMPKVAKLAKILGPKGKMPNPKSGTITNDVEKAQKELAGGKSEFKSDSYGIIHQVIGKVSLDSKNLVENYQILKALLPVEKIVSINLSATMAPGIKVQK